MTKITNGTVRFVQVIKDADYGPSRTAEVSLSFTYDEGEQHPEAALDAIFGLAEKHVKARLGLVAEITRDVVAVVGSETGRAGNEALAADGTVKGGRGRPAMTAEEKAKAKAKREGRHIVTEPVAASADLDDLLSPVEPDAPVPLNDLGDDLTAEIAPVANITDADIVAAVQKRNGETANAPAIRDLIKTFNPDPTKSFSLTNIAPAQRQDFLDKLKDVKKLA